MNKLDRLKTTWLVLAIVWAIIMVAHLCMGNWSAVAPCFGAVGASMGAMFANKTAITYAQYAPWRNKNT